MTLDQEFEELAHITNYRLERCIMKGQVQIFGKDIEYDFLAGWIKYNRLQRGYSQEALAYGICSKSHLSYFENGKKTLRGDVIEALLNKLDIHEITEISNIGRLRQKFHTMTLMIETYNNEEATKVYDDIKEMEEVIAGSPYNMEYKIHQLLYRSFVLDENYDVLKQDIKAIEKIYKTLSKDMQYLYLFVASRVIYRYKNEQKYIKLMEEVRSMKETPWINYRLGRVLAFNNRGLEAIYYLEKALNSYEKRGYYKNAMWCHSFLGLTYNGLNHYKKGEVHLKTALNGAEFFGVEKIYSHVYINLSYLNFYTHKYELSKKYAMLAIKVSMDPLLGAYNYAEVCYKLGEIDQVELMFKRYLQDKYKESKYYPLLDYFYHKVHHFDDDVFYSRCKEIIDYYIKINHHNTTKDVRMGLIQHLEKKRKYKEATKIYKDLLAMTNFKGE